MATVRIDLNALRSNYQVLKSLAPQSKTLAVVKANAYGHGLFEVASALSLLNNSDERPFDGFAVARIEEAIFLRNKGFTETIVLLEGVFTISDMALAYEHNITLVLHSFHQCQLLSGITWQANKSLCLWVKVNTGMNRLGFSIESLPKLKEQLAQFENISTTVLMTHLANADSDSEADQQKALEQFELAKQALPNIKQFSIANSAAIICYPLTHSDWNRPGIALYGATSLFSDLNDKQELDNTDNLNPHKKIQQQLKPVMQFSAPIIAINYVKKGESVGYGATWTAEKDTCVGVIGVGYGDGYPRHAKHGTPVSIAGKIYPLIGRVSMDMITVDLEEKEINQSDREQGINVGDEAILWGAANLGVAADRIAKYADTISYELFCGISSRVKRDLKN